MEVDWWARGPAWAGLVLAALSLWLTYRKETTRLRIIPRLAQSPVFDTYIAGIAVVNPTGFAIEIAEAGFVDLTGNRFRVYERDGPAELPTSGPALAIPARASHTFEPRDRIATLLAQQQLQYFYAQTADHKVFKLPLLKKRWSIKTELHKRY